MVLFFDCDIEGSKYTIYAPESKEENAQIVQHGFPSDVWFQIDGSKYMPVYLRQPQAVALSSTLDIEDLPMEAVINSCQIVKHLANAKRDVTVKYTLLANLSANGPINPASVKSTVSKTKKTGAIADPQLVGTQRKRKVDFEAERAEHDKLLRQQTSEQFRKHQKAELENSRQFRELAEQKNRGYTDLFQDDDAMQQSSNQNRSEDWEDDFM